uniref:Spondin 2b, extracellular matrix protein n=1 Tax=Oncorhynchus tshawytscha TaxID=74940 RepID=A0AAZ3Q1I1_ONCTS
LTHTLGGGRKGELIWSMLHASVVLGGVRAGVVYIHSGLEVPYHDSSGTGGVLHSTAKRPHNPHYSFLSPQLSFVVQIVPSWFLGVDGFFNLRTHSGFTFSSPNFETIPQDKVTQITSSSPNHPANSCYYPRLKNLTPMGKVTLTKINKSLVSFPLDSTPLDCEVSVWSPWGLCKGKCGDSSVRNRTRYIHLQPANNWVVCPPLEEEIKYISNNCLCLAGRSKKQKRRGLARRQRRRKIRPSSPLEKPKL